MIAAEPDKLERFVAAVDCWNVIFEGPGWLYVAGHAGDRTLDAIDQDTRRALEESAHWATPETMRAAVQDNVVTYRHLGNGWIVAVMPHAASLHSARPKN